MIQRRLFVVACSAAVLLACGGTPSRPSLPMPTPEPIAVATPTPAPAVVPSPTPTPCPPGECPEEPTTNTAPPVKLNLRLYTVEDGKGNFIPNPDPATPILIGYYARIDVTAKDENNRETNGRGPVVFEFDDLSLVQVLGTHTHQRRLLAKERGELQCWAIQDGVRSNTLKLSFAGQ